MSYQQAGIIDKVPLYLEAKKLTSLVLDATPNFPKGVKYTVGAEMHRAAMGMLRNIALAVHASTAEERLRAVELHLADFELLKGYLEISFEKKWLGMKAYAEMTKHVLSIGRQGTAWKRNLVKGCGQSRRSQG